MKARHLVRSALGSLLRSKVRMVLAVLGIVAAIAAVIAMVAVGEGVVAHMQRQLEVLGRNVVIVTPGSQTRSGFHTGAGTITTLVPGDADAIRVGCPSVARVSPGVRGPVQAIAGGRNRATVLFGISAEYFVIRDWRPVRGELLTADDTDRTANVCMLGATVARDLFRDREAVGEFVRAGTLPLRVVGVLAPKGQADGQDQDDVVLVPWTTAMRRARGVQHLSVVIASARSAAHVERATGEVADLLRRRHAIRDDEAEDFSVRSLSEVNELVQHITSVMMRLVVVVALASLVVGGIGVMNIMLVTVLERTREIGLRMAVGARRAHVLAQFLAEAVLLSSLGGLAGIAIGVGVALAIPMVTPWHTRLTLPPVVGSFLFSTAMGVVFGFYPAVRASRLDPIEALRCE